MKVLYKDLIGIMIPPRKLEHNCAYKYINNLCCLDMKLLPESIVNVTLKIVTKAKKYIEVQKSRDNNVLLCDSYDENDYGDTIDIIIVNYLTVGGGDGAHEQMLLSKILLPGHLTRKLYETFTAEGIKVNSFESVHNHYVAKICN